LEKRNINNRFSKETIRWNVSDLLEFSLRFSLRKKQSPHHDLL
jgi:hypothetical protein